MPEAIQGNQLVIMRGGRRVIDGLSFSLGDHGLTAVMGPNGAGKSLTLRLIAGLVAPDRGSITFDGNTPNARDLAVVFQSPIMLRRSVRGNLAHTLRLLRHPKPEERINQLLRLGGLEDFADDPARQLSGGEKQRLALVRALAGDPRFLLLDEPTASLDPTATAAIEGLIRATRDAGTRVILITHDQYQARRLADDVLFLHKGKRIEAGPAETFFTAPKTAEAQAYLEGELLT